jgi:hypothetical protein
MMDTREQIAANAESLRNLNRRIHETFARRSLSSKERGEWSKKMGSDTKSISPPALTGLTCPGFSYQS